MSRPRIIINHGEETILVPLSAIWNSTSFLRLLNNAMRQHSTTKVNISVSRLPPTLIDGVMIAVRYLKNEEIILNKTTAFHTYIAARFLGIPDLIESLQSFVYFYYPAVRNQLFSTVIGSESEEESVVNHEPHTEPLVKGTQSAYQLETLRAEEWEGSIWKETGTFPHPAQAKEDSTTDSLPHAALIKETQSAYELETLRAEEWEGSIWKETGIFPHPEQAKLPQAVMSQYVFDWHDPINDNLVARQQ